MMGLFVHILQQTRTTAVKVQIIQSVSILMQNINTEKSLCTLSLRHA
jgi:hypothetical protein